MLFMIPAAADGRVTPLETVPETIRPTRLSHFSARSVI